MVLFPLHARAASSAARRCPRWHAVRVGAVLVTQFPRIARGRGHHHEPPGGCLAILGPAAPKLASSHLLVLPHTHFFPPPQCQENLFQAARRQGRLVVAFFTPTPHQNPGFVSQWKHPEQKGELLGCPEAGASPSHPPGLGRGLRTLPVYPSPRASVMSGPGFFSFRSLGLWFSQCVND